MSISRSLSRIAIVLCLLAAATLFAQVQQRVLPNGLTVLVKEVHAAPVVTVDVWYKAGSRNERPGITGISHLLEHMTYKGAKGYSRDAMRDIVKRNGAIDNGATYYDYTHYHTTIASDRMTPILQMEAARMSSATLLQKDLDAEWTVVRSELEGRENDPGSLLFNETMAAAFKAHPYQWPVIGWRSDVQHTNAADLMTYYKTYYVPNNATLVVVGDVKADDVFAQAKKYFGGIRKAANPPQWATPEPDQRGERRVTVRRQGKVPFESIIWHVPALTHEDAPAVMLLDQVLGTGRLSRLYQQVVEKRIAVSAWSSTLLLRDTSIFMVGGMAGEGQDIKTIERAVLAEVERMKITPPTADEMARGRRQLEASIIFSRDSVTEQAEQLGYYQTVAGDWAFLDRLPERLKAVTPEDIARVAKTYLTEDNRTVGVFEPTSAGAKAGTITPPGPAGYHDGDAARNSLTPPPSRGAGARGVKAAPATTGVKAPVARERIVLPNGLVLVVQENHANPTLAIDMSMRAGKAYDPAGRAGIATMIADLLDAGTKTRTANQIAEELEGSAASISAGTGWETVGIHGKALIGDAELLVRNLADLVRNPIFPDAELAKMREQNLAGLAYTRDQTSQNAYRAFYRAVLPEGHPYRVASFDEEEAGLKAITRDDLLAFHQARYTPRTAIVVVVGDVKTTDIRALVEKYFGDWQGETPKLVTFPPVPAAAASRVVTRIPDKAQVNIYAGYAGGLRRTDPDYFAAQVMNMILGGGGALNSRLGDVIRDKNGLVYGVYSGFHASTGAGPWYTAMGVNPANVDKALDLLKAEIARMRDGGATQQEVDETIAYVTGAHAIALETNAAIAGELLDAEYFNLGLDYPERFSALYRAVTRDQVNAAAKKFLQPDNLVTSIAGSYGK
jgi:zinc protease